VSKVIPLISDDLFVLMTYFVLGVCATSLYMVSHGQLAFQVKLLLLHLAMTSKPAPRGAPLRSLPLL
jgi:hypothetical protein